jgi:DNA-directed RNA polymerase specialized sigma24 family protein
MNEKRLADETAVEGVAADRVGSFVEFAVLFEPRLRRALIPTLGMDAATDATAEALAFGWEHWDQVSSMENPPGYLYRVARSAGRKMRRRPHPVDEVIRVEGPWIEPGLPDALGALSSRQRTVVWLVHGFAWKQTEVADLLGLSPKSVQTHLKRGTAKLARALGATNEQ